MRTENQDRSYRVSRRTCLAALLVSLLVAGSLGSARAETRAGRLSGRPFILNQDSRDYCRMPQMTPGKAQQWLREWYRRAFAAGVSVLVADVATPELVVTKDTPTGEIIGARHADNPLEERFRRIKEMMAEGTDILHILCEERRKTKALVLAGMRMSDAHQGLKWKPRSDPTTDNLTVPFPQFILDHPEWCNTWEDGSRDATLNYAIPEVRAHRLQILRELATNYDVDGLELDWMRHCRHFPAGRQREYLTVMTPFVAEVRAMLDEVARRKGVQRMVLGHRVPVTLEESLNIGLDVATWAKRGFADYLAPMDFLFVDPNLRTEEFVEAVRGTSCLVYPSFGSVRFSNGNWYHPRGTGQRRTARLGTLEQVRALAANWYAWGATGGSSYNMGWLPEHQDFFAGAIAAMSSSTGAMAGPRHYVFMPTWKGHVPWNLQVRRSGDRSRTQTLFVAEEGEGTGIGPTGRHNAQSLTFTTGNAGQQQTFTFRMADGRKGEALRGWLRLRIYNAVPDDRFTIRLNGKSIPNRKFQITHLPDGELSGRTDAVARWPEDGTFDWPPNLRFEISLEDCPPFKGDNQLGVTLVARNPASAADRVMEAVEVFVR